MTVSLDNYIASRLHGHEDLYTREEWQRSLDAYEYFNNFKEPKRPFPPYMDDIPLCMEFDSPAPGLFIVQDRVDWFKISRKQSEIRLEVDFDNAPSLETIYRAFNATRGEAELLVVGYPGKSQGAYDLSVQALYILEDGPFTEPLTRIFGKKPNGFMDYGWEWF